MRNFYVILLLIVTNTLCIVDSTFAQVGQWVWIHGSKTANSAGSYVTKGVPSLTNEPPATYEGCEWTDKNGNFWFFGGVDPLSGAAIRSDLWKYDPATNMWTWMNGPGTPKDTAGSYGVQGVASSTNRPPCRAYGVASWVDLSGNLWMFGGWRGVFYSDLWKYDISANQWTWMKGPSAMDQPGVYGTQGVANINNHPGNRCEVATAWTDNAGDLWMFGGIGADTTNGGEFNDLWRYNIASNSWTWMKGSNTTGATGVYGTQGVEAAGNTPNARVSYARWKDNTGKLWLFGGGAYPNGNLQNDLWRYNPATNNWAWIKGSNTPNAAGVYGTKCVQSILNTPGARYENRATWTDAAGNFWMFGGGTNNSGNKTMNDLWNYNIATNIWTWVSGDSTLNPMGNWGTLGVSSPTNKPSGRTGALAWSDGAGHLYLFGGHVGPYNDLWKYTIDSSCVGSVPPPVALFHSSDSAFCGESGGCADFFDMSTNNPISWNWSFPGATPSSSTQQNPTSICYYTPGTYAVTLIAYNSGGSDTIIVSPMITVEQTLPPPFITQSKDTLYCSPASSYQWYNNGVPISGATNSFYVALQDGVYSVLISDSLGCTIISSGYTFTSVNEISESSSIKIYPNPTGNKFTVYLRFRGQTGGLEFTGVNLDIFNVLSEKVFSQSEIRNQKPPKASLAEGSEIEVDVSTLSSGIYIIKLSTENNTFIDKFVKE